MNKSHQPRAPTSPVFKRVAKNIEFWPQHNHQQYQKNTAGQRKMHARDYILL